MKRILQFLSMIIMIFMLVACGDTKNTTVIKEYSALGKYEVSRYPLEGLVDNYVVYYSKDAITEDMPVVLFLEGGGAASKIDNYRGIMQFMASQGYFVIGAESGESYRASYAKDIFDNAIEIAKNTHGLNISKLIVMGHSLGGGQSFYVMKHFRDMHYGEGGSLVVSIDGWFAFSMNEQDLNNLETKVAFIQMNNLFGTGTDPRINLTIWSLLHKSEKSFFILPNPNHSYVEGDLGSLLSNKRDLLFLISALNDDIVEPNNQSLNAIPMQNRSSYNDIDSILQDKSRYLEDCEGVMYGARGLLLENDIDYCKK